MYVMNPLLFIVLIIVLLRLVPLTLLFYGSHYDVFIDLIALLWAFTMQAY